MAGGKIRMDAVKFILDRYNIDTSKPLPYVLPFSRWGDFVRNLRKFGYKTGVEVGVDRGLMSKAICMANPGVKLYCVDPWITYDEYGDIRDQNQIEANELKARERLAEFDVTIIKKASMEAVKYFAPNSVDFVWIDGNHAFDWVMEDIIYWSRIVRPGGIVAGHDYGTKYPYWGVIQAVNAYVDYNKIDPWFIFNTDKSPGWFWIKK